MFKNVDSADKVMKNKNSHNLMGKWIDCKRAQPKENLIEMQSHSLIQSMEYVNNQLILV